MRPVFEGGQRLLDLAEADVDLVGKFVGVLILVLELRVLGLKRFDRRLLLGRDVFRRTLELPKTVVVAVGEADSDLDPLPALGRNGLGFGLQLLGDETLQQRHVLQPTAIVALEQVAQNCAAGGFIGRDADELRALVRRTYRILREHAPDLVRFIIAGLADILPDLLLTGVIARDGKGHELFERHAVLGIHPVKRRGHRRQAQALLHDCRGHEMPRGDVFLAHAEVAQGLERAKLVERMEADTFVVFRDRVVLGDATFADDAGNGLRLGHALLLHQQLEGAVAAPTGRNLEHAGLVAIGIANRAHVKALQQRALRDALGQLLDRDAGLDAPHVRLAEHKLVEGNVARGRQGDLLNGLCHLSSPRRAAKRLSLGLQPVAEPTPPSHSHYPSRFRAAAAARSDRSSITIRPAVRAACA